MMHWIHYVLNFPQWKHQGLIYSLNQCVPDSLEGSTVLLWYVGSLIVDSIDLQHHLQLNESKMRQSSQKKKSSSKPSKCELMSINDVPNRLKVIATEPLVRTGFTARNLMKSCSGSKEREKNGIFLIQIDC